MSEAWRQVRLFVFVLSISGFGLLVLDLLFFADGLEPEDVSTWAPWVKSRLANGRFLLPLGPPLGAILVQPLLKQRKSGRRD